MDEEAIPILRVADAAAAVAWYGRLGFTKEWEHRFKPGLPLRDLDGNRLRIGTPTS